MKSNFNELFAKKLNDLKSSKKIDIEDILDELMPLYRYKEPVTKTMLIRNELRNRLTSALNANEIYSCEEGNNGHFVYIKNANEDQLLYMKKKAEKAISAAESRKAKSEEFLYQISAAWDENGKFIGFIIPEAKVEVSNS